MNYEIKMTYEAETEVLDSANWYDSEKMGVGDQFLEEFNKVIQRIARNPYAFPVWEGVVRRALVSKYPFQIFYWIESETTVKIVAISHTSRKPGYWGERVE